MDTAAVVDDSGLGLVAQWAISLMEFLREPGAGVAIALENLFPPIPSEVILPLAGFVASQGTLNIWLTILWTTLGSIVGAMALYGLGAWLGLPRLRAIADRLPGMRVEHIDRTVDWFERNGGKAVFLGRFLPLFRSLISIPAGIVRMSIPLFLMLTAAGSLIWNTIFIVAGYVLGEQWKLVEEYAGCWMWCSSVCCVYGSSGSSPAEPPRCGSWPAVAADCGSRSAGGLFPQYAPGGVGTQPGPGVWASSVGSRVWLPEVFSSPGRSPPRWWRRCAWVCSGFCGPCSTRLARCPVVTTNGWGAAGSGLSCGWP